GVSFGQYVERAVRVYAPGLTDLDYDNDEEARTHAASIRVEAFTDARPGGWTALPAKFATRSGNDFVYSFRFVEFYPNECVRGLEPGYYRYKLRFSTDGGETFTWLGTELGPDGGDDLMLSYDAQCSYFGDPFDCI